MNNNINNFKQFNEMADYNETMTIEDLIYVMEQFDPNAIIVGRDLETHKKEDLFIIDAFHKIESKGMEMSNKGYSHSFNGDKYDFYTYEIESDPNKRYGTMWSGNMTDQERSEIEPKLHEHKTIRDLIEMAKQIPNPSKSLFFMPGQNVGYEKNKKGFNYDAPKALGNYNIKSYPLARNKVMLSGNIVKAGGFMAMTDGRYELESKR
jgi:hypothetical protein